MGLSTPGIGSNLDVDEIVKKIVEAKTIRSQKIQDAHVKKVTTELSAVGQVKSALSDFQSSLNSLSDLNDLYGMKYSLSTQGYFTAQVSPDAVKGIYQVEVQKLAQQHTLATNYFPNSSAAVGSGTMTINFGTYSSDKSTFTSNPEASPVTITINPGSDSLSAIRDAINNSESGVVATIVQDSQGARLTLSSAETGQDYAMQITGDLVALNYDPTTANTSLTETRAAQNSVVQINGLVLSQNSNTLEDAITGITLNLNKAEPDTIISLTVEENKEQLTIRINDFIKKYNDAMTLLTNLTGYDAEKKQGGIYQGDPQFRNLKLNLTRWATSAINNNTGKINSLAELGIKTNRQGLLEIKQETFDKALTDNYANIGVLFAKSATSSNNNMRINSVGKSAPAGTYDVRLSEYTPAVSMSGSIGAYEATSTDGINLKGSGALASVNMKILSGSVGSVGQITITDGIAIKMTELLQSYLEPKGELAERKEQLDKQTKQLDSIQTKLDNRRASLEARYFDQFTKLDGFLTKMTALSNDLSKMLGDPPSRKSK